jgi:phosphoribosylanthranilate isomerase
MIVKICGICSLADALSAAELGADALGFNFYPPSPRFIRPAAAKDLIAQLDRPILSVGVLVGTETWSDTPTAALQLHGLTGPEQVPRCDRRVFVAVAPEQAELFPDHEILIDTSWGRGKLADWDRLAGLARPFILSGGLTPDNVGEAVKRLHPIGVDVCSSVESAPGKKDPDKIRRFIEAVRRALES